MMCLKPALHLPLEAGEFSSLAGKVIRRGPSAIPITSSQGSKIPLKITRLVF